MGASYFKGGGLRRAPSEPVGPLKLPEPSPPRSHLWEAQVWNILHLHLPQYPIRETQIPYSLSLFPEAAFLAFLLPKFQETLSPGLQVVFLVTAVLRASSLLP